MKSKIYLICGKICSGKSTYSQKLRDEHKAVILSVDEITLVLFIFYTELTNPIIIFIIYYN